MKLPILAKLKDGEKFDFSVLTENIDETREYWRWWWAEKSQSEQFARPEIISDDDDILFPTDQRQTVNCYTNRNLFDSQLFRFTELGIVPARDNLPRDGFRNIIKGIRAEAASKLEGVPQLIFTAGGYASGKTSVMNQLSRWKQLPVCLAHTVNADIFKQLIPEYSLIRAVGDGRASLVVHQESVALADQLFRSHVAARRSFIFDSSMAYQPETMARIKLAKEGGYHLTMVGVLTPLERAVRFAMHRAKKSRRFSEPEKLVKSHQLFHEVFRGYFDEFDEVIMFANHGALRDIRVVAEKRAGEKLVMSSPDVFNSSSFLPDIGMKSL